MRITRIPLLFLLVRLVLFLSLPLEGLAGYGDLGHFIGWARLEGWPFLDYWMEFPPAFPFFAEGVYRLAAGREQAFFVLLAAVFSLAEAGCLLLFLRIAKYLSLVDTERRAWLYFGLLAGLFYGWTYFDPLALLALLAGLAFTLEARPGRAGLAFGLGALVKWFPVLGLAAAVAGSGRGRWRAAGIAVAVLLAGWGIVALASPDYTAASLRSQSAKGSWETVWALLDGNLGTGNFGAKEERFDPAAALVPQGRPPVIPPWIALLPFAAVGVAALARARSDDPRSRLALAGLALALFLLWSPGWSPQWVLYLLPFVLLLLPWRRALLLSVLLVLVNLLEWPLLLSRGMFWGLYLTVPIRTLLIGLLAWETWRMIRAAPAAGGGA